VTITAARVVPITADIGAEIRDVDVRDLDDRAVDEIRAAIHRHRVVFLRDQDITDDEHVAFAERFGTVTAERGVNADARFQIVEDTAENPPHTDQWHTDMTCWERPPAMAFLSARVVPETGGDTVWVNLCSAYWALSPAMRAFVDGLHVRHIVGPKYRDAVAQVIAANTHGDRVEIRRQLDDRYEGEHAVHPLVRTHPVTGEQALFLSPRFAEAIVELAPDESAAVLAMLDRLLDDQNFQVRWRWRANDLAVWDEAATNHRALADHFLHGPQHRLMRRCTIAGTAPFHRSDTDHD
jgi:taurine dioxygenase